MNFILAAVTIITMSICGPGKHTVSEETVIKKNTTDQKIDTITYKKVPTKWVKITKKSN